MKFGNEFWLILFREYISPKLFAAHEHIVLTNGITSEQYHSNQQVFNFCAVHTVDVHCGNVYLLYGKPWKSKHSLQSMQLLLMQYVHECTVSRILKDNHTFLLV
jgi:hypothetical protein